MEREFKHPQIFADVLTLCQLYYPMHNNLPKHSVTRSANAFLRNWPSACA